jgi:hypothetical protein
MDTTNTKTTDTPATGPTGASATGATGVAGSGPTGPKSKLHKAEEYVKNPTAENQDEHRKNLANLPPVPSERAGAASSAK